MQRQRSFGRIQQAWSSGSMAPSRRSAEGASTNGATNIEKARAGDDGK